MNNIESISIEITNNCNNNCLICPHGHNLITKKGFMTIEIYEKILTQIEILKDNIKLELHGIGESLLHPQLLDMISLSTKKGFTSVLCTNAIILTLDKAKKMFDNGLKRLIFSLETRENYEKIRSHNIYDFVLENIKNIASKIPGIEIEIFWIYLGNETDEDYEKFKNQFENRRIIFNRFRACNWRGKIKFEGLLEKSGEYVRKYECPLFKKYCSIDFLGNIRHCYIDYNSEYILGNLLEQNFEDIWLSKKRKDYIEKMKNGEYANFYPCCECVFPFVEKYEQISDEIGSQDLKRPEMQLLSKIKSNL